MRRHWALLLSNVYQPLLRRREWATGSVVLHNDSLTYDRRGKVRKNTIVGDTVGYTALGYVIEAVNVPAGGHEQYRVDALGLRRFGLTFGEGPASSLYHYQPHSERLDFAYHQQSPYADTTWYGIGLQGNVNQLQHVHPIQLNQLWYFEHKTTANTYASDGKLRSAYYTVDTTPTPPNLNYKVYHRTETYRYDALGRRVWTQMLRDTALNNCFNHDRSSGCRNEVTRTVWDGDQILYELRAPADTITNLGENDNASGTYNGRVGYTNVPGLLGIDQPLDLFKSSTVVIPYTDWRGRFDKGTCPASLCSGIEFAGGAETVFHNQSPGSNGPPSWYGNVIADLHDGSGFEYRRNRYYDPQTGRFTQEDPIGLAGGLNLYGFANGDPANFGDPFGLQCEPFCANQATAVLQMLGGMAPAIRQGLGVFSGLSIGGGVVAARASAVLGGPALTTLGLRAAPLAAVSAARGFPNGDFERTFETSAGTIRVFAEAVTQGRTLTLNNFMVYPDRASRLQATISELRSGFRSIADMARTAGYNELIVNFHRTSGANIGKLSQQVVDLTKR